MNFNIGNTSSSSDNNDDEGMMASFEEEEDMLSRTINDNNLLIQHLLNQQNNQVIHGGSVPGRSFIGRDRESADIKLFHDYFSATPLYNDVLFRRRYRLSRSLFVRIVNTVKSRDHYFMQRTDSCGRSGLSYLQKITAVFRMLTYGQPADATDEYVKIGESTAIESLKRFCRAIVEIFSYQYLRSPTANDIARLLFVNEKRGFPGMLGSLDCMHWKWKNCPTGWAGQYSGRSGSPTIILEDVADYDLWIWHAYFGIAPPAHYVIQGKEYNMGYYLVDGIYPKWSTLVQTIHKPTNPKKKYFSTRQEACRKDVERAFGVLQSRFAIVQGSARFWKKEVLHDIMTTCIILHNMIIEDERDFDAPIGIEREVPPLEVEMTTNEDSQFQQFLARYKQIKDKEAHFGLRNALVEHL